MSPGPVCAHAGRLPRPRARARRDVPHLPWPRVRARRASPTFNTPQRPAGSGFFHSARCFPGSSALWRVSALRAFLWLHSIPLCVYTTICLSFHLLMGILVVSTFGHCESGCCEQPCTSFWVDPCFHFSWLCIYEWSRWVT